MNVSACFLFILLWLFIFWMWVDETFALFVSLLSALERICIMSPQPWQNRTALCRFCLEHRAYESDTHMLWHTLHDTTMVSCSWSTLVASHMFVVMAISHFLFTKWVFLYCFVYLFSYLFVFLLIWGKSYKKTWRELLRCINESMRYVLQGCCAGNPIEGMC